VSNFNDNNTNKHTCIAPLGRNFRGAGVKQCATEQREESKPAGEKRNVFSLDLNNSSESEKAVRNFLLVDNTSTSPFQC